MPRSSSSLKSVHIRKCYYFVYGASSHMKPTPVPAIFRACNGAGSVCTTAKLSINAMKSSALTLKCCSSGAYALRNGSGEDIMPRTASLGITTGFYCIVSETLISKWDRNLSYAQKRLVWHLGHKRISVDPLSSSLDEIMLNLLLIYTNFFTVWRRWRLLLILIIGHISLM